MPSSSTEPAKRGSLRVNLLVSAVTTVVLLLLVEGFASVLMSYRAAKRALYMQEESHVRYDADLGWSNRPGLSIENLYGEKGTFTTNSQGLRAGATFDKAVPAGKYRLVALGDSFTMGFGVGDASSYPAQLEALCPALQTVNMGQGGYGVDQDYLWYKRDGVKLDANVLLFAVIAHDFYRMASDNFIGYGKPVLRAGKDGLVTGNVPPPKWSLRTPLRRVREFFESLAVVKLGRWLARSDARPAEQFYGTVSEGVFAAAGLAFDDLAKLSRARGQRFVLVYLPISDLLAKEPTREAAWLQEYARRTATPLIDLVPEFSRLAPAEAAQMFRPDYHYTEKGNRFVAEALLRRLAENIPDFPRCGAPSKPS